MRNAAASRNAEQIKDRGKDIGCFYSRRNHLPFLRHSGLCRFAAYRQFDEQRYMRRRIVEEDPVSLLAVFSQPFAMITNHDDQGVVVSFFAL